MRYFQSSSKFSRLYQAYLAYLASLTALAALTSLTICVNPGASRPTREARKTTATPRIVSLAPSNSELLCTVGAEDEVIGVCTYCDDPHLKSVDRVGTFVSANLERLARLNPDLIMLVSGQEQLAVRLQNNHFKTLIVDNSNLANIGKNIEQIGRITGHNQQAAAAARSFAVSLEAMKKIIGTSREKPRVFYCVWPQPLMTAGKKSFIDEIITTCGGINVAGDLDASYPTFSLERLLISNPDVLILPYEARGQSFINQAPWNKLRAVQDKRVYYLPDAKNDMLSRPTLRVFKGIQWLASLLHPELAAQLRDCRISAGLPAATSCQDHLSLNNVYMRN